MIYNQLPYSLPQYTALKATRQPTIIAYILSPCALAEVMVQQPSALGAL